MGRSDSGRWLSVDRGGATGLERMEDGRCKVEEGVTMTEDEQESSTDDGINICAEFQFPINLWLFSPRQLCSSFSFWYSSSENWRQKRKSMPFSNMSTHARLTPLVNAFLVDGRLNGSKEARAGRQPEVCHVDAVW